MANSKSAFLNPDRNPLLHILVRKFCFDHFTAGATENEVRQTIDRVKSLGFRGVILGYAKEVNVTGGETDLGVSKSADGDFDAECVRAWRDGTMNTLSLIGPGDLLAIKFSGAGKATLDALAQGGEPPQNMWEAMLEICDATAKRGSRLWIDAEQQDLQPTIDKWTQQLMRRYNRGDKALIYATMQAYLKHTEANIGRHLALAQAEGWIFGVKLVRGAYIATERHGLIHDTIEDTHAAYDRVVGHMLRREYPGVPTDKPYPRSELFLATHNDGSIRQAWSLQQSLLGAGRPTVELGFGQLQGMADEVGCSLVQLCREGRAAEDDGTRALRATKDARLVATPNAFKCLTWGTTRECLQYLLRRVRENADAFGRTKYWAASFRNEILRRLARPFSPKAKESSQRAISR
ncbi:Delta-1-pyrroline-5-carboxylate dehydrogenase, mitochondrial [Pestalotiopsis sp. IQ-011]